MRFKGSLSVPGLFTSLVASLVVFFCLSITLTGCEKTLKIEGTYELVPDKEQRFDGTIVEVMEFLSFYCKTCYAFERSVLVIKGNFPKKLRWRVVPIYWGKGSPKPGEAYLLALEEGEGKGEKMKKAIFDARFLRGRDIGSETLLVALGKEVGLSSDFERKLRTGVKAAEAEEALKLAAEYKVKGTPAIIVAGNINTNPQKTFNHNMDALRDNIITIIKSILR